MNISNLLNFSAFGGSRQTREAPQAVADMSPLALAVQRADQRVQSEVSSNTALLSSFGQLKSSVSQVQIAAQTLSTLPASGSGADSSKALKNLLSAVNSAVGVAHATALLPGTDVAAQSAERVARDLHGIVSDSAPLAYSLKAMGISLQNGALQVDSAQFHTSQSNDADAVQGALISLGQVVERMTSTELASTGDVMSALSLLKRQASTLQAQQSALQSAAQATAVYSQPRSLTTGHAVAAYQSNIG